MAPYTHGTIELDFQPHNLGLNTAWMRAQDRSKWRQLVETAMLTDGRAILDDDEASLFSTSARYATDRQTSDSIIA